MNSFLVIFSLVFLNTFTSLAKCSTELDKETKEVLGAFLTDIMFDAPSPQAPPVQIPVGDGIQTEGKKRKARSISALDEENIQPSDVVHNDISAKKPKHPQEIKNEILQAMSTSLYGRLDFIDLDGLQLAQIENQQLPFLHVAVKHNHIEAILWLGGHKVDPNAIFDGETALHISCYHKNYPAVHALMSIGANPLIASKGGRTPLVLALEHHMMPVLESILTSKFGQDNQALLLNAHDILGVSVLEWAFIGNDKFSTVEDYLSIKYERGCLEIINRILQYKELIRLDVAFARRLLTKNPERFSILAMAMPHKCYSATSRYDFDMLFWAVQRNNLPLIDALHTQAGVPMDRYCAFDPRGRLPIHMAICCGLPEIFKYYLSKGVDPQVRSKISQEPVEYFINSYIAKECRHQFAVPKTGNDAVSVDLEQQDKGY